MATRILLSTLEAEAEAANACSNAGIRPQWIGGFLRTRAERR